MDEGVAHAPQTAEQLKRFKALAAAPALPPDHMIWRGEHLFFPKAQIIDPAKACAALLGEVLGRAESYRRHEGGYDVLDANGKILAAGSHIIFAAGAGIKALQIGEGLELRYSRGQISWAKGDGREQALTYGGYALPIGDEMLLGATHARLGGADPYIPTAQDDALNFDAYRKAVGSNPLRAPRACVRRERAPPRKPPPRVLSPKADENLKGQMSRLYCVSGRNACCRF